MAANTILIVEDDGILCLNMEDMLTAEGYEVMGVLPSGEAALELVKERQPDLIIMDINLAGELDGISTVEQIKKIADIPVIYLTAYAENTLIRRARETAPYAFLVKPVQERELIATIEMALHRHSLETKLIETEKALRQSEQRLILAQQIAKIGDFTWDLETGEVTWSDGLYELLCYDKSERIDYARVNAEIHHPEDLDRVTKWLHDCIASGMTELVPNEYRLIRKDKKEIYVHTTGIIERNKDNQIRIFATLQDITERKRAEETLRESEESSRKKIQAILEPQGDIGLLSLGDIIDHQALQSMMDEFYQITKVPNAVVDLSGKVLVHAGWQDICLKFHRVHPETLKNCHEEVTILTNDVAAGTFKAHRCKNNLWDIVTPIEISGKRMGNIFIGQFFYEDETPDYDFFRRQARQYGFDETEYLAALERVPRLSRELVEATMGFYSRLAGMISSLSYSKIHLSRTLAERKQAEQELNLQKELLSSIIEGANVATWEWDVQTGEHIINEKWAEIIGYTLEELTPVTIDTWVKYCHPEDLEQSNLELEKHFSGEVDFYNVECRMKHKDGHWVWVNDRGKVITWSEDGKPQWIFGTLADITERKQAENALRESEARNRAILNALPDLMFIFDRKGIYLDYHTNDKNLLAVKPDQFLSKSVLEVLPADIATLYLQGLEQAHKTKELQIIDYLLDVPDGSKLFEAHITPMDEQRLLAVVRDITVRKLAEEAIKEKEAKYHGIFNAARDAFLVFSKDGSIIEANPAACRVYNYPREGLVGLTGREIVHPDYQHLFVRFTNDVQQKGYFHAESVDLRSDGSPFHVEINGTDILFNGQDCLLAVVRDITERKRAEQALSESEQRFRYIAEFSPLPLCIIDGKGNYEYINPQFTDVFGYTLADIPTGKRWFELAYPDPAYRQQVVAAWKNYQEELVKNVATPRTFIATCKNGMKKEILFRIVLMDNEKYLLIYEDITDRKQAEEKLRESELFLKETQAIAKLGGWKTNPLTDKLIWNDGVYDIIEERRDYRPGLAEGIKYYHTEYLPALQMGLESCLAKGDPFTLEAEITTTKGNDRWVEVRAFARSDSKGEPLVMGTIQDITDRKRAEQKLADYTLELEQLYHQLDGEINKARQVHERILPAKLPEIPGISFAPHYQPAQTLGGDFYDIMQKDDKFIFYLSDVSGHGLDGAMLSVFVKHTIKSYISFTPADSLTPAAILRHLAGQFGKEDYPEDLYVCLFMAVLDLASMELTYCGAGLQEALLVQLGNGNRQKLHSKGMFISSYLPLEILKLQENSITLTPGSTIFCNTDGLTEQENNGTYYRDRLPDTLFQNAYLPAHLVAQSVLEDFRQFNNGSLQGKDDITFLVLQVEPPGPEIQ